MREMLSNVLTYAKKPLLQHPRLHESLKYLNDLVFGDPRKADGYVIKGLTKGHSEEMTMLYFGTSNSAHQLASLIYAQVNQFLPVARTKSNTPPVMSAPEIVAFDVPRPFARKFSKHGYLLLPNVHFVLDMRISFEEIMNRMSRRRRRDIKKIDTLGYSYEICRNSNRHFDFFYNKIYLPYAKSRFGNAAYVKPYLEAKTVYESNGGIIFVKKNEKPLAGILFNIQGRSLHAWNSGVYEGNQQFIKELAGEAALLFLIQWARNQGVESLDYGVSLPFLQEGIFTYKKEWGMSVNEQRDNSFCALRVNPESQCSLTFLQQNPFIVVYRDELKGVVFIDHRTTRVELQEIHSRYYFPNLHSLIVISYYKPHAETMGAIEPEPEKLAGSLLDPLQKICKTLQEKGFQIDVFEF